METHFSVTTYLFFLVFPIMSQTEVIFYVK